ncbi:MAG TPA: uridine phosphorylase [Deltaproteobacteria bacterium]|nr:uridine phosphorylase [Deltaproteobacteria bacterium]
MRKGTRRSAKTPVYHLALSRAAIGEAALVLMPGDPKRSVKIAEAAAARLGGRAALLADNREYRTYLVESAQGKLLVTSTGIGGPSTSIAVDELAQLGVRTFIRVGTAGAISRELRIGDVVVTTGSVRLDGASTHYAPIEYPAVADHEVVTALIEGAEDAGARAHRGITASSDTFYPGEERTDSFTGYVLRRFQGATEELRRLRVLNYEMESATVLTLTAAMGLRGGCVTGVINRAGGAAISKAALRRGETSAVATAVNAAARLLGGCRT